MGCGPCCMLCVFSSIASPGMMDLQNEVSVEFRKLDHSSALCAPQVQSTCSKTSTTPAETSPSRGRRQSRMEAPRWKAPLELLGTAPDVCGDCSPLDTLLGFGMKCLVSLPFRADGVEVPCSRAC